MDITCHLLFQPSVGPVAYSKRQRKKFPSTIHPNTMIIQVRCGRPKSNVKYCSRKYRKTERRYARDAQLLAEIALYRDTDAILVSPDVRDICQNIRCRTPHRTGFYFAGPALEGTDCGDSKVF